MVACFYSWNLATTNMPWKWRIWEGISPIIIIFYLFFTVQQNACKESQLATSIVLQMFFFSSHFWSHEFPWDLMSLWNRFHNQQVCGLWSNHLVCTFKGYKAKNQLKLSSCLLSPMVLKSVKIWKLSNVSQDKGSRPLISLLWFPALSRAVLLKLVLEVPLHM